MSGRGLLICVCLCTVLCLGQRLALPHTPTLTPSAVTFALTYEAGRPGREALALRILSQGDRLYALHRALNITLHKAQYLVAHNITKVQDFYSQNSVAFQTNADCLLGTQPTYTCYGPVDTEGFCCDCAVHPQQPYGACGGKALGKVGYCLSEVQRHSYGAFDVAAATLSWPDTLSIESDGQRSETFALTGHAGAAADDVPKAYLEGAFPQVPRATWYQNQYLMVPQGSERATAPWESEYMVIPRHNVSLNGTECGKIGSGMKAWLADARRCERDCVGDQLDDYRTKGTYFLQQYGTFQALHMTSSPATLSYTAAPHNVTVRVSLPSRLLNYTEITVQSLEVMGTGESTDAGALTVRPHAAVRLLVRGSGLEARMRLTLESTDNVLVAPLSAVGAGTTAQALLPPLQRAPRGLYSVRLLLDGDGATHGLSPGLTVLLADTPTPTPTPTPTLTPTPTGSPTDTTPPSPTPSATATADSATATPSRGLTPSGTTTAAATATPSDTGTPTPSLAGPGADTSCVDCNVVIFLCPVLGSCLWATLAIVGGMIMSACCFLMLLCACRCYVLGKCATRTCCCRPGPHRNVPKRHPKRGFFGQSKFAAKHPAAEPTDPQIGEEGWMMLQESPVKARKSSAIEVSSVVLDLDRDAFLPTTKVGVVGHHLLECMADVKEEGWGPRSPEAQVGDAPISPASPSRRPASPRLGPAASGDRQDLYRTASSAKTCHVKEDVASVSSLSSMASRDRHDMRCTGPVTQMRDAAPAPPEGRPTTGEEFEAIMNHWLAIAQQQQVLELYVQHRIPLYLNLKAPMGPIFAPLARALAPDRPEFSVPGTLLSADGDCAHAYAFRTPQGLTSPPLVGADLIHRLTVADPLYPCVDA